MAAGEGIDLKYNIQMLNAGGFLEREFSWDTQVCALIVFLLTEFGWCGAAGDCAGHLRVHGLSSGLQLPVCLQSPNSRRRSANGNNQLHVCVAVSDCLSAGSQSCAHDPFAAKRCTDPFIDESQCVCWRWRGMIAVLH